MRQFSAAEFSRNTANHQSRLQQQPKLARQAFSSELRHKDFGSGDLASAMSLPTSSGTEGRGGPEGGPRAPNKRKGGRSRKAPPSDSQAMQRCLDVVEQLLEEEDAEPFAEPVSGILLHAILHINQQAVHLIQESCSVKLELSILLKPMQYMGKPLSTVTFTGT